MINFVGQALAIVLCLLSMPAPMVQAATHQTVPGANFSFMPTLQTFLQEEDADRLADLSSSIVLSGGIHSTAAGLVGSPSALTAYLSGHYTIESGTITYPDASVCWVIAHTATTGNVGSFTRVSGTHYLINCGSTPQPALPNTSTALLMKVTTSGGAITAVTDLRPFGALGAIDACRYATLTDLLTAVGTRASHVILSCHLPVPSNASIPATLSILPSRSGAFAVESGVTITMASPRQIPFAVSWQIFEGASTAPVSFTTSGDIRPEWWGAGVSTSAANNTTYINRAIDSQPANSYTTTVWFSYNTYQHDNSILTNSRNICLRGAGDNSTTLELTTVASARHGFKTTGTTQFQCARDLTFATATVLTTDSNMSAIRLDADGDAPGVIADAEQLVLNVKCVGYNICVYGDGDNSFRIRTQLVSNLHAIIGGSGATSGVNEGVDCQRILICAGEHIHIDGNANADHGLYALTPRTLHYTDIYIDSTLNEAVKLIPSSGVASLTDPLHWTFANSTILNSGGAVTATIDQDYDLAKLDLSNLVIVNDSVSASNGYAIVIQASNTAKIRSVNLDGLVTTGLNRGGVEFITNDTATIQLATLTNVHAYDWSIISDDTYSFIGTAENGTSTLSTLVYSGYFDGATHGRSIFQPGDSRTSWALVQALAVTELNTAVPEGHPLVSRMATSTATLKLAGNLYCTMTTAATGANTTETDLASYTLPAGAMNSSISGVDSYVGVHIRAWGTTAANANTKTIRLKFDGTTIDSNSITTAPNNQDWVIDTYLHRLDSTNQKGMTRFDVGATTQGVNAISTTATLANAIIIKVTGQNGTSSSGDISLRGFCVDGLPH